MITLMFDTHAPFAIVLPTQSRTVSVYWPRSDLMQKHLADTRIKSVQIFCFKSYQSSNSGLLRNELSYYILTVLIIFFPFGQ